MKEKCPYCEKEFYDIIAHISIRHNITNMDEVDIQSKHMNEEDRKKEGFSGYVKELNEKLSKGQISGEIFRNEVQKWYDDKKWLNKND